MKKSKMSKKWCCASLKKPLWSHDVIMMSSWCPTKSGNDVIQCCNAFYFRARTIRNTIYIYSMWLTTSPDYHMIVMSLWTAPPPPPSLWRPALDFWLDWCVLRGRVVFRWNILSFIHHLSFSCANIWAGFSPWPAAFHTSHCKHHRHGNNHHLVWQHEAAEQASCRTKHLRQSWSWILFPAAVTRSSRLGKPTPAGGGALSTKGQGRRGLPTLNFKTITRVYADQPQQ